MAISPGVPSLALCFLVTPLVLLQGLPTSDNTNSVTGQCLLQTVHSSHRTVGPLHPQSGSTHEQQHSEESAKGAANHLVAHASADSQKVERPVCTDLVNHGTHFTVEIEVGTPGQKFDVVADTGSDAIIVPSCACVKAGYCNGKSRCFQGTNHSSTFSIDEGPQGPPTVRMMFGSGPVQAVLASDTVRVGKLHTKMKDGLLLMTDQMLNIQGPFEGILGLGLPSSNVKKGLYQTSDDDDAESGAAPARLADRSESPSVASAAPGAETIERDQSIEKEYVQSLGNSDATNGGVNIFPFPARTADITEDGEEAGLEESSDAVKSEIADAVGTQPLQFMNLAPTSFVSLPKKPSKKASKAVAKQEAKGMSNSSGGLVVKGFLEEAGITRFSMCFNDGANGVLRLGQPKAAKHVVSHASIGQVHWGLDFRGISVGNYDAPVKFCKASEMGKGQKTPCGAIPDSGTTAFMAPKEHLISLYESLCDGWGRCKRNHTAMVKAAHDAKAAAMSAFKSDPFHIEPDSKAVIFQQLILDCNDWLSEGEGLDELPPIHFHIGGANGTKQTLNLFGWSYIIETQEKEFKYIYKKIPGIGKLPTGRNFTGQSKKVCSPAFSTMDYSTEQNGPVWILGTPIFYEYQVGYDLESKPPSISFSNSSCGSCGKAVPKAFKSKTSLMSQSTSAHQTRMRSHASVHQPRIVNGPFRVPNLDYSKPL